MRETSLQSAAAEAAPSQSDFEKETLISGERILAKFHPHPASFIRWYLPSLLLFVWTATYLILYAFFFWIFQDVRNALGGAGDIAPLLLWSIGAILIGLIMPRDPRTARENTTAATFLKAVHYLYFVILAIPFILYFVFRARTAAVEMSPWVQFYALLTSVLMILLYDMYRRSFTYFVTNFRVIFRYKFFKTAEHNLRFSQIRDVEVNRSFLQRVFKLGNVRPYTGTEEELVDLTPGYDSPDECFFGVRNPEYVKRLILEQMLGPTDSLHGSVYGAGAQFGAQPPMPGSAVQAAVAAGPAQSQPASVTAKVAAAPSPPAGSTPPASGPSEADSQRVKRLEEELNRLRREQPSLPSKSAPSPPPPSPPPTKTAASVDLPAPPKSPRLSDVTPTVGVRPAEKPAHAEFGDDRDSFASSDESFRGAKKDTKKPGPPGTVADDDDKPRGI
jgi:hypothetical protein